MGQRGSIASTAMARKRETRRRSTTANHIVIVSPHDCGKCHARRNGSTPRAHTHGQRTRFAFEASGTPRHWRSAVASARGASGVRTGGGFAQRVPNSGSGRINPDGSRGSCTSCHSATASAARGPAFGVMRVLSHGRDSAGEIYAGSRHGAIYAPAGEMHLDRVQWRAGEDYVDAPTLRHVPHEPRGADWNDARRRMRLAWRLATPVPSGGPRLSVAARDAVVCGRCHDAAFITGHFRQMDGFLEEQRGGPAAVAEVLAALETAGRLTLPERRPLEKCSWKSGTLRRAARSGRHGSAAAVSWTERGESRSWFRSSSPKPAGLPARNSGARSKRVHADSQKRRRPPPCPAMGSALRRGMMQSHDGGEDDAGGNGVGEVLKPVDAQESGRWSFPPATSTRRRLRPRWNSSKRPSPTRCERLPLPDARGRGSLAARSRLRLLRPTL